jgi:hydrogenase expression/formation protein HypE
MPNRAAPGKIPPEVFEAAIAPLLGAARSEVLIGPRTGADCAVVRAGAGRVLVFSTDPISLVPALGPERSARLACHLLASDVWTSGIPPAWVTVCFNLPPDTSDETLAIYWHAMGDEWNQLGVAVVAGHTGRYQGCGLTIIGAATVIGVGDEVRYLTPAMASPGDRLIVTKSCAYESAAIAAQLFPKRLGAKLADDESRARARALIDTVSVVADCIAILRIGVRDRGVSALHDATEGGVLGGMIELARVCGHDLRVARAALPLSPEARAACEVFEIDPYWALSEGTLIACVRPQHAKAALASLADEGIPAVEVGEVVEGRGTLWLTEPDGRVVRLTHPEPDPYWEAYARAVRENWE